MNVENTKALLEQKANLATNLGMEFISTPDPDSCKATMPVDERTSQPFGFLSGGATLALAETLAGVGSCSLCPECHPVGMTVTCNHVHSAPIGTKVTATAHIIHQGNTTHVWQVDVRGEKDELISNINVTNYILYPQKS